MPATPSPLTPVAGAATPSLAERLGHAAPPILSGLVVVLALSLPGLTLFQWGLNAQVFAGEALLPLLKGSLSIAALSLAIALPLALWGAIALTELTGPRVQAWLFPALGLAAQMPTVLYAWIGLTFLSQVTLPTGPEGYLRPAIAPGLVLALMLLPSLTFGFAETIRGVSRRLRLGAYALGAGPLSTALRVVLPSVKGALLRRISRAGTRASGESVIVLLLFTAGSSPMTLSSALLSPDQPSLASLWSLALAMLILTLPFAFGESLSRRWGQK